MIHSANWNDLKITVLREGVSRKAFTGEGATMAINYFKPGHSTMPHSHKYEQIAMILEGEAIGARRVTSSIPSVAFLLASSGEERINSSAAATPSTPSDISPFRSEGRDCFKTSESIGKHTTLSLVKKP